MHHWSGVKQERYKKRVAPCIHTSMRFLLKSPLKRRMPGREHESISPTGRGEKTSWEKELGSVSK